MRETQKAAISHIVTMTVVWLAAMVALAVMGTVGTMWVSIVGMAIATFIYGWSIEPVDWKDLRG